MQTCKCMDMQVFVSPIIGYENKIRPWKSGKISRWRLNFNNNANKNVKNYKNGPKQYINFASL
jgi:hypothetical protein